VVKNKNNQKNLLKNYLKSFFKENPVNLISFLVKNKSQKTQPEEIKKINLSSFSWVIFIVSLVAIFIGSYCNLFDEASIAAKNRVVNNPLLSFIFTPVFFWISASLCRFYSPKASGNNFYPIYQDLEKNPNSYRKISPLANIKIIMVKAFSSIIACFAGGSLGKEAPSIHMSAGIFANFATKYQKFLPNISIKNWVLAGTASGLAIAFAAPISGIILVIEKISKSKINNLKNLKTDLSWSLIIVSIIVLIYHPNNLFAVKKSNFLFDYYLLIFLLIAIFCSFVAMIFYFLAEFFYHKIASIKTNWWHLIPISIGILVSYINYYAGIHSFSGGIIASQQAFASEGILFSYNEVIARIFNTILTYISGCAGGLIAPAMAIGTGIGSIFASYFSDPNITIFMLVGMTAFLGAILGEPITAAIIVFETTGYNYQNLPYLVALSCISSLIFKKLKMSNFYLLLTKKN
jgi:H+/Cl- antiporter ClcA